MIIDGQKTWIYSSTSVVVSSGTMRMSSVFVSKRIESLLSQEHAEELHILEYKFLKVEYHTS